MGTRTTCPSGCTTPIRVPSSTPRTSGVPSTRESAPQLLFPVFKTLTGSGSNAQYDIIAWIGFHLTSWSAQGNSATLNGDFTQYIAHGILATGGNGGAPSSTWGVKSIQLIR